MARLGGIYTDVRARNDKYKRDLDQSKSMTEKANTFMQKHFDKTATSLLKMGAAAVAFNKIFEVTTRVITDGFQAVEQMKLSTASLASTITSFSKRAETDLSGAYQQALGYSGQLVIRMEELNAQTVATGANLNAMVETLAQSGVLLDLNNKKQEKGFLAIANALALMTQGQNQDIQFRQEIRGLIQGEVRATNLLARLLSQRVGGELKKHVELWKEQGTLIENAGALLTGFQEGAKDLANTWLAVGTTLETMYTKTLRGLFVPIYEDIIRMGKEITSNVLDQNKAQIELGETLRSVVFKGWQDIKNITESIVDVIAAFKDPLTVVGKLLGLILDGWGQIFAILPAITNRVMLLTQAVIDSSKMLYAFSIAIRDLMFGNFQEALTAWETGKSKWFDSGKKTAEAFSGGLISEIEKRINEYNKDLSSGTTPSIDMPILNPTKGKVDLEKQFKALAAEAKKTAKIIKDSFDIWGDGFDIDMGGIDKVQAAIDLMLNARNNEALALERNIDLQNRMAQAVEDTYDIDNGGAGIREINANKYIGTLNDQLDAFSSMKNSLIDVANLYEKGSDAQQIASAAAKAANIAEIATLTAKNVMIAVGAVVNQGTGDPYTAFARMAAMAAAVAGVLSIAGIAFSGGGGSGGSFGAVAPTTGTVLGSSDPSQSSSRMMDLLEDMHADEYSELQGIYSEMIDLNSNISGLVSGIVRSFGNFSGSGFNLGTTESSFDSFSADMGIADLIGRLADPILGAIFPGAMSQIFGGGSETSLQGSGLEVGAATVQSILDGADLAVQKWTQTLTYTEGGWFSSSSDTWNTYFAAVNDNITDLFTKVGLSMGKGLESLDDYLGTAIDFSQVEIDFGTIDLMGLEGSEINEKINEVISTAYDNVTEKLFSELFGGYQQIGEGFAETMIRLVGENGVVMNMLDKIGMEFDGTTQEAIAFSQALIGMSGDFKTLAESFSKYYDNFFSDAEKQADIKAALTSSLGSIGLGLAGSREDYRSMVEGIDTSTESGKKLFTKLLDFSETADEFYSYLEDQTKEIKNLEIQALTALGETDLAQEIDRQMKLAEIDTALHPLQEFIWSIENAAESVEDFSTAFDTIQATIDSIMGGGGAGVLSKDYFESRYSSLLAGAQADPSKVADFTGFANEYLSFISDYGDPKAMEKVLNDLFALQSGLPDPVSLADEITGGKTLSDLYTLLAETGGWNPGASEIESIVSAAYANIGREGIGTGSGNIDQAGFDYWLESLISGAISIGDFHSTFEDASVNAIVTDAYAGIGRADTIDQAGFDFWVNALISGAISQKDFLDTFNEAANPSFADGGVISGPTSGYTIPTTFHGVERITPESDFQDLRSGIQQLVNNAGGNSGDIIVEVHAHFGKDSFKPMMIDVVRKDRQMQTEIKRAANV